MANGAPRWWDARHLLGELSPGARRLGGECAFKPQKKTQQAQRIKGWCTKSWLITGSFGFGLRVCLILARKPIRQPFLSLSHSLFVLLLLGPLLLASPFQVLCPRVSLAPGVARGDGVKQGRRASQRFCAGYGAPCPRSPPRKCAGRHGCAPSLRTLDCANCGARTRGWTGDGKAAGMRMYWPTWLPLPKGGLAPGQHAPPHRGPAVLLPPVRACRLDTLSVARRGSTLW